MRTSFPGDAIAEMPRLIYVVCIEQRGTGMNDETPSQRKWRLIRERQEAKAARRENDAREIRRKAKHIRDAMRERRYHDALISDHNHDMDD